MKLQAVLLSSLLLSPTASFAQQRVFRESYCYENIEEYIPGYYNAQGRYVGGYVKSDRRRVPCRYGYGRHHHQHNNTPSSSRNTDDNSCVEGAVLGGILGGGAGAALSRGDGRWWAIPLGIVGGSMVGCQVDGG